MFQLTFQLIWFQVVSRKSYYISTEQISPFLDEIKVQKELFAKVEFLTVPYIPDLLTGAITAKKKKQSHSGILRHSLLQVLIAF